MTLLGGLRCTKLALKRALGPAKEAPRGPQKATSYIVHRTGGVMLEPLGPPKYLSKLRYQYYRTGRTGGLEPKDLTRRWARRIYNICRNLGVPCDRSR